MKSTTGISSSSTHHQDVARTPQPDVTSADPHGIHLAGDIRSREWDRLHETPSFTVTAQDIVVGHASRSRTLDSVIAEVSQDIETDAIDQVIYQGSRVVAVVQVGLSGRPVVVRFDGETEEAAAERSAAERSADYECNRMCEAHEELAMMKQLLLMPKESAARVVEWAVQFWGNC